MSDLVTSNDVTRSDRRFIDGQEVQLRQLQTLAASVEVVESDPDLAGLVSTPDGSECPDSDHNSSEPSSGMLMDNSFTTHPSFPLQVVGGLAEQHISSYYDLLWCADPCYNYQYFNYVCLFSPNTMVLVIHYPTMTEMHFELRQIRVLVSNE